MRRRFFAGIALFFSACASEPQAVLEIGLELSQNLLDVEPWGEGAPYLFVQFRPASEAWPFDAAWASDPRDPEPLSPWVDPEVCQERVADGCRVAFSLVSRQEVSGLRIKARLCFGRTSEEARCQDEDETNSTVAAYFELEHPFYLGRRTWWSARIDEWQGPAPAGLIEPKYTDRCGIAGCTEDAGWDWNGLAGSFCSTSTDRHFCEGAM